MTTSRFTFAPRHAPASAEHIRYVAGPVSDGTLAALLEIGATPEELELATAYIRGEGDVVCLKHYTLTGRVKRIFDILSSEVPATGVAGR